MATGKTQAFFNAIYAKVLTSAALAAVLGSETAADHVITRRFRRGSEAPKHAQLVLLAPMIYCWPGYANWSTLTADHGKVEASVNVTVVQTSSTIGATLNTVLEFSDALVKELQAASDGTGGAASFLSDIGHSLKAKVETPSEDGNASQSEVKMTIVFTATLHPVV